MTPLSTRLPCWSSPESDRKTVEKLFQAACRRAGRKGPGEGRGLWFAAPGEGLRGSKRGRFMNEGGRGNRALVQEIPRGAEGHEGGCPDGLVLPQKKAGGRFFERSALLKCFEKCKGKSPLGNQYMPPPMPAAAAAAAAAAASPLGSGLSATTLSVVSTIEETDAAFSSAERVTLAGSTMPTSNMST